MKARVFSSSKWRFEFITDSSLRGERKSCVFKPSSSPHTLSLSSPTMSQQFDFSQFRTPMQDDESMKIATLKKAYAEIILNTSKEAAARIMVADRRALCFQKDLFALKEDALRMLVQLKQMLDLKTTEGKVRSENQEKKIEDLEAQLSEAEGKIVNLREELNLTQNKLEKIKFNKKQPLRRHTTDHQDQQPQLKNHLPAKTVQYPSNGNASTTKYPADKDVKSRNLRYSPSSSESDEKDLKITSNGSAAKSLRDGFRRTRKNVKYQEAIAALCKSSRGRRSKSYRPPSFRKCRKNAVNQNDASIEIPNKNGMHSTEDSYFICSSYEMNDIAPEISNFREMEDADDAEKELDLRCDEDPHKFDSALADCNVHDVQTREETDRISKKVLKFTFQRKRKRAVLTKLDNNMGPALMKQGDGAKLPKLMMRDEEPKDSQQLLQLADTLIKLSGNGCT